MKKVLLLGDSIRLSYQDRVRELLSDVAEVVWPEANCQYTLYTIWNIRFWFRDYKWGKVDLIHWNNGTWDHHRCLDDGEPLSTPEEYLFLNRRLHRQLKTYTDNLIWATTTPAGTNKAFDKESLASLPRDEWNKEIGLYNDLLSAYLRDQGVAIDDIHGLVSDNIDYICEDGFHLNSEGVQAVARQVADCIRSHL